MKRHTARRLGAALLVLVGALSLFACGGGEKTYSFDEFSITMEAGLAQKKIDGQTYYLEGRRMIFAVNKQLFSGLSGLSSASTVADYVEAVFDNNGLSATPLAVTDGATPFEYFTYEKTVEGKDYFYLAAAFKGTDSFFLCNFSCFLSDKDSYQPKFLTYAQSIQLADAA